MYKTCPYVFFILETKHEVQQSAKTIPLIYKNNVFIHFTFNLLNLYTILSNLLLTQPEHIVSFATH
jgi:hypothetical protein